MRTHSIATVLAIVLPLVSVAAPVVTSVTPGEGWDGEPVVIAGSGFDVDSTVTFDGVLGVVVSVDSANQISAEAPAAVTSGPVVVTSLGVPSNDTVPFLALLASTWDDSGTMKPLQGISSMLHDSQAGTLIATSRWRGHPGPDGDNAILEFDLATRQSRRLQGEREPSGLGMDDERRVYYATNFTHDWNQGELTFVAYFDYAGCPAWPSQCAEDTLFGDHSGPRQITSVTVLPSQPLVAYVTDNGSGSPIVLKWTQGGIDDVFVLPGGTNFKVPSGASPDPTGEGILVDYADRFGLGGGRVSQLAFPPFPAQESYIASPGDVKTPAGIGLVAGCPFVLIADRGNHRVIIRDTDPGTPDSPVVVATTSPDPFAVAHVARAGDDHVYVAVVATGNPPVGKIYRYRLPDIGCGCDTGTDPALTRLVPDTYATIQFAVDAAAPGDYILLAAGTYVENTTIAYKNGLTIRPNPWGAFPGFAGS